MDIISICKIIILKNVDSESSTKNCYFVLSKLIAKLDKTEVDIIFQKHKDLIKVSIDIYFTKKYENKLYFSFMIFKFLSYLTIGCEENILV